MMIQTIFLIFCLFISNSFFLKKVEADLFSFMSTNARCYGRLAKQNLCSWYIPNNLLDSYAYDSNKKEYFTNIDVLNPYEIKFSTGVYNIHLICPPATHFKLDKYRNEDIEYYLYKEMGNLYMADSRQNKIITILCPLDVLEVIFERSRGAPGIWTAKVTNGFRESVSNEPEIIYAELDFSENQENEPSTINSPSKGKLKRLQGKSRQDLQMFEPTYMNIRPLNTKKSSAQTKVYDFKINVASVLQPRNYDTNMQYNYCNGIEYVDIIDQMTLYQNMYTINPEIPIETTIAAPDNFYDCVFGRPLCSFNAYLMQLIEIRASGATGLGPPLKPKGLSFVPYGEIRGVVFDSEKKRVSVFYMTAGDTKLFTFSDMALTNIIFQSKDLVYIPQAALLPYAQEKFYICPRFYNQKNS